MMMTGTGGVGGGAGQPFGGGFGVGGGGFGGAAQPFAGGFGAPSAGPIVFGGGAPASASGPAPAGNPFGATQADAPRTFGSSSPSPSPSPSLSAQAVSFPPPAGSAFDAGAAEHDRKKSERAARFQAPKAAGLSAEAAPFAQQPTGASAPQQGPGQQQNQQHRQRRSGKKNIVGTCEDMCPPQERARRQSMSDIQIFERLQPDNMNLTSAELAVKRFARTVDDPHPSEFRTRGALARTMAHLRGLLDREDVRFGLVHKFLWDRYRSVRQDLYIQGITDGFAIGIFEEIVRFHVMCEHELCGEDQSVTDMEGFNSHLNMEQMNKALISLNDMYEKAAERGAPCPTEPEFRAYHLLSVMAQHGKFKGDQQAFLSTLQALRADVREDERVRWVLKLRNAYYFGNFARFFRLVGEAPYLLACLAHVYFPHMRATCFKVMSETCAKQQTVEASWLVRTLMLEDAEEALAVAKAHGFLSSLDSGDRDPVVVLTKGGFEKPDAVVRYPSKTVSAKSGGMRRSDLILTVAEEGEEARRARIERVEKMQEAERRWRLEEEDRRRTEAARAAEEDRRRRLQEEAAATERRRLEAEAAQAARAAEAASLQRRREEEEAERERVEQLKRQEALRKKELEAASLQRRREEEEAERERVEQLKRQEALRKKKIEEERRQEALRKKKIEEERRLREEEARRRLYLLGKLREAILARRHWDMWLEETRERLAERERRRIMKLNLKGCRVGVQIGRAKRPRVWRKEGDGYTGRRDEETGPSERWMQRDGHAGRAEDAMSSMSSMSSITDIVEPVLVDKAGGGHGANEASSIACSFRPSAHPTRMYWKVPVLTRAADVSGDPLARRLRARAFQSCSHSTDLGENSRGELIYAEGEAVSTCVHFVPGWNPAEDALVDHLAGSSGLIVVDVDAETLGRALSIASDVWRGPKLPVLIVAAEGTPASHTMESGFPVRTVPMDEGFPDAVRWLASSSPPQPSFVVTTLKDCISQGIRSMVYSSSREDAAIELVLSAIDDAHESKEARWQWPPREFDLGDDLNEWWTGYERLVRAVRDVYVSMDGKTGLSLLAVNQVLDRYDARLVLPLEGLGDKYGALLELSCADGEGKENVGVLGERAGEAGEDHQGRRDCRVRRERKDELPLRQRLAALDEEVELLKMEGNDGEARGRRLLFGFLPRFW